MNTKSETREIINDYMFISELHRLYSNLGTIKLTFDLESRKTLTKTLDKLFK